MPLRIRCTVRASASCDHGCDCVDWIHIGSETHLLTANQQKIKEMLEAGRSHANICGVLRIRREHLIEEIYEIRKKTGAREVNMKHKGKLTPMQRAAIYDAYKNGTTQIELSKQYGVSNQAISKTISKLRDEEQKMAAAAALPAAAQIPEQEPERKAASINQDFENAIDKMIEDAKAEKKSANAEKNAAIAEVSEPVQDPEPGIDKAISPVIRRLVTYGISDMESEIEEREQRIAELKMEIEEFQKDIEIAKAWKEKQTWK